MDECDPRWEDLIARESKLLAAHQEAWIGPIRGILHEWDFRRGFLDHVEMDSPSLQAHSAELFRQGSPRSAIIFVRPETLPALLANEHLLRFREIHFTGRRCHPGFGLQAGQVQQLVVAPTLKNLTAFGLKDNGIGPEGARQLTRASWLANLRSLKLTGESIGAAGMEALPNVRPSLR